MSLSTILLIILFIVWCLHWLLLSTSNIAGIYVFSLSLGSYANHFPILYIQPFRIISVEFLSLLASSILIISVSQSMRKLIRLSCLLEVLHWPHTQSSLSIHELWGLYHHHPSWILIFQPLLALIHWLFHLHLLKLLLLKMLAVRGGY